MKDTEATAESEIPPDNSTLYVGMGLGLGGYVTVTSVLAGFVCPVCGNRSRFACDGCTSEDQES